MQLANAYHHFITITTHKLTVMDLCFRIGLIRQGILHDLSKYSPEEFRTGILYYQGVRSPNAAEKREKGYSVAWLHHKGRNKHHYEYWIDVDPARDFTFQGVKMPLNYVLEMVCDRIAASKVYNGDRYNDSIPWEYYQARTEADRLHPETRALLEKLLIMLRDEGEFRTLGYMRWLMKHPDRY
ncbi:MAG: catalase [Stomatobaculum sp.]|nr:catalase [Stomatobaculum sp.]